MNSSDQRWWDLLSAFLYLAALLTAATRLEVTDWTAYLERVQFVALLAGILGLALGQSRFSPRKVFWLAIPYTLYIIPWQIGVTLGVDIEWSERLQSLGGRFVVAWGQFIHSQPVTDPILFLVLMSLLFWVIGVVGGYQLTRYGNAGVGILTAGIALFLVNNYHVGFKNWALYFGFYLLFSLLLLGRVNYLQQRVSWQREGVTVAPDTAIDINRILIGFVLAVVIVVWNIPGIAHAFSPASRFYQRISKPWVSMRDRLGDAFSSLKSSVGYSGEAYGDRLSLGNEARSGEDIIFIAQADELPPEGTHFYWHGRSYDHYENGVWSNTFTQRLIFTPTELFDLPDWSGRKEINFIFTPQVTRLDLFYTAPQPVRISRSGEAITGGNTADGLNVVTVFPRPGLRAGDVYRVTSRVAAPTVLMLQESGTDYPNEIRQEYLQVPEDISPIVVDLAESITRGFTNPYDQAAAITDWLRSNISYTASLKEIPAHKDLLEWFLFEEKKGFCNYYATADVMMLRIIGVPARIAVGFAPGDVENGGKLYTVRSRDAHAWVEVYFNRYGWVEFEPTVIQSPFVLPTGDETAVNSEDVPERGFGRDINEVDVTPESSFIDITPEPTIPLSRSSLPLWMVAAFVGIVLSLAALVWAYYRSRMALPPFPVLLESQLERGGIKSPLWVRRWARGSVLTPLERAFRSVNTGLRYLAHSPEPALTPADRVNLLAQALPAAAEPLAILLAEYEFGTYSLHSVQLERARRASRQIRWLTLCTWLRKRLHRRKPTYPSFDHFKGNRIG